MNRHKGMQGVPSIGRMDHGPGQDDFPRSLWTEWHSYTNIIKSEAPSFIILRSRLPRTRILEEPYETE